MASISNRTGRGSGCPKCRKAAGARTRIQYRIKNDQTDFKSWCEQQGERGRQLLKEWNYELNKHVNPSEISYGSTEKVFWQCKNSHIWKASLNGRTQGRDCPICSGKKVLEGYNDLQSKYPLIAKEWNYKKNGELYPNNISYGSEKKVWWICEKGHEWQTTPNQRTCKLLGCPFCSHKAVLPNETSLASVNPLLAEEWDTEKNEITAEQVFPTSKRRVWWKCSVCGYSWQTAIGNRIKGSICPKCSARNKSSFPEQAIYYYIKKQHADAQLHYQEIFDNKMELDIYIPSKKLGIEYDGKAWHSSGSSRIREAEKYAICKKNGIKLLRIKETHESVNNDCDFLIISRYTRDDYHSLDEVLDNISNYIKVPPHDCIQDELAIKSMYISYLHKNSLQDTMPELISEWDKNKNGLLTPKMFTKSSSQRIWWRCETGHLWRAPIYSRTQGHGCPYCANQRVWKGYNDLESIWPELIKEWDYQVNTNLDPDKIVYTSNRKVGWVCMKCGHKWNTTVYNRSIKGTGCPKCNTSKHKDQNIAK